MLTSIPPSPADAKTLADAKVVFTNGLGFEGWIGRLIKSSNTKAPNVVTAKGIKSRKFADAHGHSHGDGDPHAWQSVPNVKIYVANIRDGLISADPAGKAAYEANAAAYLAKLDALDREVREAIAKIPVERAKRYDHHPRRLWLFPATPMASISSRLRACRPNRRRSARTWPASSSRSGSRRYRPFSSRMSATRGSDADRRRNRCQDRRDALFRRPDPRKRRCPH